MTLCTFIKCAKETVELWKFLNSLNAWKKKFIYLFILIHRSDLQNKTSPDKLLGNYPDNLWDYIAF